MARFLNNNVVEVDADRHENNDIISRTKRLRRQSTPYRNLNHVVPTSNVVERLFSRTKLFFSDRRQRMKPKTLETLIMLLANSKLWDSKTVEKCVREDEVEIVENGEADQEEDEPNYEGVRGHVGIPAEEVQEVDAQG